MISDKETRKKRVSFYLRYYFAADFCTLFCLLFPLNRDLSLAPYVNYLFFTKNYSKQGAIFGPLKFYWERNLQIAIK